jgi:DUF1680 family protein
MSDESQRLGTRTFQSLPLGAVKPRGWLERQLAIQADGLTGHIDETWDDLSDNAWLGGEFDGWERGPYYADGLVPLAYLLEDEDLVQKVERWVDGFLDAQDDDGWFTPEQVWARADPDDPWSRYVICKVLRQYYEATGDDRALDGIVSFAEYLLEHPDDWEINDWAEMRWMDLAVELHWLYERTREDWVLDIVDLLVGRGFDWIEHFTDFEYEGKQLHDPKMSTHVVNNAMGIKAPAVHYRQRGTDAARRAVYDGIDNLDRFHGQVTGLFTGDEHFSGKNPSQGTELCAVVEYMYSLEYLVSTLGDVALSDRLERITYNALPATFMPDMWAHQYDQQANQVLCNVAERSWTNGPDSNVFGQGPNFGCCHANFHQGWPKFVASMWMRTPDGGLAATAYGPSEATARVGDDTTVTVVEETEYPFEDAVTVRTEADEPVSFPMYLRIPSWADDARLSLPSGETTDTMPGEYHVVERDWQPGDEVVLSMSPDVETERRHHGSVAVLRGPLVFSYPVEAEGKLIDGSPPAADWEFHPTEPWNYGLDVDTADPASSVGVRTDAVGDVPFSPDDPPMELTVRGRLVPEWQLEDNWAGEIPHSPTRTDGSRTELTLVPYGSTMLRVTEFPLLD